MKIIIFADADGFARSSIVTSAIYTAVMEVWYV